MISKTYYNVLYVFILAGWLFGPSSVSVAAGPLAIQDAKIITVTGETIQKGNLVIRDGRIEAVGSDVEIPNEALVIDGTGKVVMPGFIDAHNADGMSQANEQNAVVPFLSVVDSIDPNADYFEECRRNGITTASVVPGNSTLIGGKTAIVKTAGQYVNDMIFRRDAALKLSLRPTSGNRMSQMAALRRELDKAQKALDEDSDKEGAEGDDTQQAEEDQDKETSNENEEDDEGDEGDDSGEDEADSDDEPIKPEDEGLAALKLAVQGKMPVFIYCEFAMDVAAAERLEEDYGLKTILVLGRECHKAASLLADRQQTVILDPTLVYWETDSRTREDTKIILPDIYRQAGVPFIFQIEDPGSRRVLGASYLWYQAATSVKYGTPRQEALAALTIEPAKLLGIDDFVGSIEVGKDADLVLLSGEPLDIDTWVEQTIVGGEVVYRRAEDEKLERLLSPVAE